MKSVFNNKGFTLIESLMALMVYSFLIINIMQFMLVLKYNVDNYYNDKQLLNLSTSLTSDFIATKEVEVKDDKLINYLTDGEEINYKFINDKLIRQVDNKGGEVLLLNVEDIKFVNNNGLYEANIKFKDNKEYKNVILKSIAL
ncbi:MAG: competence type IV pilus minor pilin ComGF [Mycoplasmatales bacterium]